MASSEKRCLYEVLGLPTDCSADDIRSAYKRLAVQRHPDKLVQSGLSQADATAAFQELVNAYEVLYDPRERAWYDSHRSQILFSNPNPSGSSSSPIPNLFSFFSNSVFSGYSDSGKGFYRVYSDVFDKVYANEVNFAKKLGLGAVKEAPVMGNLDSPYSQVKAFYDYWLGFVTVMDFCWVDQYDAMAGVNRKSRRVMEEENKKLRKKARREYNETVRGLAEFVKKRDKRVIDMMVKKGAEMEKRKEEERERRRERERERAERVRAYEEPEWAKVDKEEIENRLKEMEDGDSDKKRDGEEFYCVVCGKKFKSEKQWKNHEQSKKHKEKVAELRESFRDEDELEEEDGEEHEEGKQEGLGGNLDEHGTDSAQKEHGEDGVDELNQRFRDGIGIEEENIEGEASSSNEEGFDYSGDNGMKGVGESLGSDDETSVLEAMVSGHRSRRNAGSMRDKSSVTYAHVEINIDSVDFMEYDNGKSVPNNRGGKRRKGKEFNGDVTRADDTDVNRPMEENGEQDSSNMEDSSSHSFVENDTDDKGDHQFEGNHKIPSQRADKKGSAKQETNTKSKNSSKGRKQKVTAKNSGNACETCGAEFESRNKLHKHLGDTGHASLKYR